MKNTRPMNLAKTIDHTLLKAAATGTEIETLCAEAVAQGFYSVCVNSCRVSMAARLVRGTGVHVVAVTGFPLGAAAPEAKARETSVAVADGAGEIDTVINIGWLLGRELPLVLGDLKGVVRAAGGRPVKVILETCFLDAEAMGIACDLSLEAGAAFVKTSTGFGTGGATLDDVRFMKARVGDRCLVKASGGIRDRQTALDLLAAGASRLGTSSGIAIVSGGGDTSSY
jgi:deoxyribose-phosphate aldolase